MKKTKKAKREFNWFTKLNQLLRKRKPISDAEYQKLVDRASQWPTCACGQLCKALPRDGRGVPIDETLENLGVDFLNDIQAKEWLSAIGTFSQIEARTAQLLRLPITA